MKRMVGSRQYRSRQICTLPISVSVASESDGPLAVRLTTSSSYPEDLLKKKSSAWH